MYKPLTILLVSATLMVRAQSFTVYDNTNSELISNNCTDIQLGPDGRIWVGTSYSGISVFEGTDFTNYTEITSDLVSDFVNDLVFDNDGNLWITTLDGISVFDGTGFTTYDTSNSDIPGKEVLAIEKDHAGNLWMHSKNGSFDYQGLTKYDGSNFTTYTDFPTQLDGYEFEDFGFTADNTCWIASNGISKYNGTWNFYPYATTELWSSDVVAVDASDNVYAAGFAGILKYSGGTWSIDLNTSYGFPDNTLYYDMYIDGGYIWMGSSQGLLKYQMSSGNIVENYNSTNSPLGDNCVGGIVKDATGVLWLATNIGVVKLDEDGVAISQEQNTFGSVDIFPNPTNGIINIQTTGTADQIQYTITDLQGNIVLQDALDIQTNNRIDLGNLASGMYLLKMIQEEKVFSKKIVVN